MRTLFLLTALGASTLPASASIDNDPATFRAGVPVEKIATTPTADPAPPPDRSGAPVPDVELPAGGTVGPAGQAVGDDRESTAGTKPDREPEAGRPSQANPPPAVATPAAARRDSAPQLSHDTMCETVAQSAQAQDLPIGFFSNLIWQESRFDTRSVSPAGAQGVAQFMPKVASEVGLANPFNPFEALPAAARLLSSLLHHFGNFGLAAAAYNAGPGRVSNWLTAGKKLPSETRHYVLTITGRPAEAWRGSEPKPSLFKLPPRMPCRHMDVFAAADDAARAQEAREREEHAAAEHERATRERADHEAAARQHPIVATVKGRVPPSGASVRVAMVGWRHGRETRHASVAARPAKAAAVKTAAVKPAAKTAAAKTAAAKTAAVGRSAGKPHHGRVAAAG